MSPSASAPAVTTRMQGRYAEAEPSYKRALAISEKALGPEHPDVALRYNNLAVLYWAQGRYAEAEPLHKRALAIREKALGLARTGDQGHTPQPANATAASGSRRRCVAR